MTQIPRDYIVCGDNLEVLKTMNTGIVDLVYIDPPFFTSQNYEIIWKDGAEIRAFQDRWVKMGETGKYTKDINVYLNFMQPRIQEIYRVLKPTGAFYLHCDWHADAYLRMLCDQIFGYDKLRNHILWVRSNDTGSSKSIAKKLPICTDSIFFYTKSDDYTWKMPSYRADMSKFKLNDNNGKGNYYWADLKTYSDERLKNLIANNEAKQRSSGKWNYKRYESTSTGVYAYPNFWDDIPRIISTSKEAFGYPTQKPEALLERIIQASSNEGDLVFDCFAGCGTTLAVAKRLNRHFIGIDISPTACRLVAKRIGLEPKNIVDMPLTTEEVSALTGYEFQNYVVDLLEVGVDKRNVKVNKRGADGGIDGSYFNCLLSVKKYKAGRKDLDEFIATLYRNKQKKGIFIALEYSSDFTKEVARLGRDDHITITALTLQQIINREHTKFVSALLGEDAVF